MRKFFGDESIEIGNICAKTYWYWKNHREQQRTNENEFEKFNVHLQRTKHETENQY